MKKHVFIFSLLVFFHLPVLGQSPISTQDSIYSSIRAWSYQQAGFHPSAPYEKSLIVANKIKFIRNYSIDSINHTRQVMAYYLYDSLGNITEIYHRGHRSEKIQFSYNAQGHLDKKMVYDDWGKPAWEYNWFYGEKGEVLTLETHEYTEVSPNPMGHHNLPREKKTGVQSFIYDQINRKVKITSTAESVITYTFCEAGGLKEIIYESKSENIYRKVPQGCKSLVYMPVKRKERSLCDEWAAPKDLLSSDTTRFEEHGETFLRFMYTTKRSKIISVKDSGGHCIQVHSDSYSVTGDTLLASVTFEYDLMGQITDSRSYHSAYETDLAYLHYSQPPVPTERHDHTRFTYYPFGILRSRCVVADEEKTCVCEENRIGFY